MKLFNRDVKFRQVPGKALALSRMFFSSFKFQSPTELWKGYLGRVAPSDNRLDLRDGTKIFLSSNPHDSVTVMVNFCRNEYGKIHRDWSVIDIGANIGVFMLVAARSGAGHVYCFEPNTEAFDVLGKNIMENALSDRVTATKAAVTGQADQSVYVPKASSPYNQAVSTAIGQDVEFEAVESITLSDIIEAYGLADVDLLKLDCEGAEYEILLETPGDVLKKIRKIRMELHPSRRHPRAEVLDRLHELGFACVRHSGMIYWFKRAED